MVCQKKIEAVGVLNDLKKINRAHVLNLIRDGQTISRVEISQKSRLSRPTVSSIIHSLIKEGYIKEIGKDEEKRGAGKKRTMLRFIPQAAYAIGIEVGISKLDIGILDLQANMIYRSSTNLKKLSNPRKDRKSIKNLIIREIQKAIDLSGINPQKIIGVGIGTTGLVDAKSGILRISTYHPGWNGLNFRNLIEKKFHIHAVIDNAVKVEALGERWFGMGKEINNFIYISITEGIGAGLIINGTLYRGKDDNAGEIGHTVVDINGRKCTCGNRGCLNTMASERALHYWAGESIAKNKKSILARLTRKSHKISTDLILKAAQEKDPLAINIIKKVGGYIGLGLSNLINMFNPEAVIISSPLLQTRGIILDVIRKSLNNYSLDKTWQVPIKSATLGHDSGIIGAASLILEDVFKP